MAEKGSGNNDRPPSGKIKSDFVLYPPTTERPNEGPVRTRQEELEVGGRNEDYSSFRPVALDAVPDSRVTPSDLMDTEHNQILKKYYDQTNQLIKRMGFTDEELSSSQESHHQLDLKDTQHKVRVWFFPKGSQCEGQSVEVNTIKIYDEWETPNHFLKRVVGGFAKKTTNTEVLELTENGQGIHKIFQFNGKEIKSVTDQRLDNSPGPLVTSIGSFLNKFERVLPPISPQKNASG